MDLSLNSLIADLFEADWLLTDILGSGYLGNPLKYLLPGHMKINIMVLSFVVT